MTVRRNGEVFFSINIYNISYKTIQKWFVNYLNKKKIQNVSVNTF